MPLAFHFEDMPPQRWLDQLHAMKLPVLWDIHLKPEQRANLIHKAKTELKIWREGLQDQMQAIRKRYDKDQNDEMLLMLAPYETLANLGGDLVKAVADLEAQIRAGRALPVGFTFGEQIYGSLESGRWFFGDMHDARRFEQFERTERRYFDLEIEYARQAKEVKIGVQRVKDLQGDIKEKINAYNQHKSGLRVGLSIALVLVLVVVSMVVTYLAFNSDAALAGDRVSNPVLGGLMAVIATAGAVTAVVLIRRRRRVMDELRADIATMKEQLKHTKDDARRLKQAFFPTQETFSKIKAEYRELKATFDF